MNDLNLSDTEKRIEGFQSRLRADYAAKIQEVAKLTDVVAKLQTQLLDVEYENNVLRQQFVKVKNENNELKKGVTTASEMGKSPQFAATSHPQAIMPSLKRERSPSLELIERPEPPAKKAKGRERVDSPVTSEPPSLGKQSAVVAKVKASAKPIPISEGEESSESDSSDSECSAVPSVHVRKPAPKPLTQTQLSTEELRNAKALKLPKSLFDKYLYPMNRLDIHPPKIKPVPRRFLRVTYGGHRTRCIVSTKRNNPSGSHPRRMFFSLSVFNPSMPTRPGYPGFFVSLCLPLRKSSSDSRLTLFCSREESNKDAKWRYLGEYTCSYVGMMSAESFRMQSIDAQEGWARIILKTKKISEYRVVRARIALRLASLIPISDKQQENILIQEEVTQIKKGRGRPISEDDVIDAFETGEEEIDIFRLHCVEYDQVFACDIQDRYVCYKEANEVDSDDSDEDEDEDEDSDDEESDCGLPRPKPTASVSKAQNNSNVRSLVNGLQGTKPKGKAPVESSESDSSSDSD